MNMKSLDRDSYGPSPDIPNFFLKIYFIYIKKIKAFYKHKNLEIISFNSKLKNKAKDVGEIANNHLLFYKRLGFNIPEKLKIYLSDTPHYIDSLAVKGKMYNYHRPKEKFNIIILSNSMNEYDAISDASVIGHEIFHIIAYNHFGIDSYVNFSDNFVEAMADFMSAHSLNNPQIGTKFLKKKSYLRDISMRKLEDGTSKNSHFYISDEPGHDDSLYFSNILWSLREVVDEKIFNTNLREIFNDLNHYFDNFNKYMMEAHNIDLLSIHKSQKSFYEVQYLLSVLIKHNWDKSYNSDIRNFIWSYMSKNKISSKIVLDYMKVMKPTKNSYEQSIKSTQQGMDDLMIKLKEFHQNAIETIPDHEVKIKDYDGNY